MILVSIFGLWQGVNTSNLWTIAIASAIGLSALGLVVLFLVRRYFQNAHDVNKASETMTPRAENPHPLPES